MAKRGGGMYGMKGGGKKSGMVSPVKSNKRKM